MLNVLVPIDGSENALRALRHVISPTSICREPGQIHLLNVQAPVASGVVRLFLSREDLSGYYEEEAEHALAPAREELEKAGVSFQVEVRIGEVAENIARYAREQRCSLIAMGTRGMGSVANLLLGSVATKVIGLSEIPVLLVK
ncbi:MAG TPA: universal stress protein [Anaerolineales bacterium]|nr:universal stress protein [Anaerolineales bacterium]